MYTHSGSVTWTWIWGAMYPWLQTAKKKIEEEDAKRRVQELEQKKKVEERQASANADKDKRLKEKVCQPGSSASRIISQLVQRLTVKTSMFKCNQTQRLGSQGTRVQNYAWTYFMIYLGVCGRRKLISKPWERRRRRKSKLDYPSQYENKCMRDAVSAVAEPLWVWPARFKLNLCAMVKSYINDSCTCPMRIDHVSSALSWMSPVTAIPHTTIMRAPTCSLTSVRKHAYCYSWAPRSSFFLEEYDIRSIFVIGLVFGVTLWW